MSGTANSPTLTLPASEQITAATTLAVTGVDYLDSMAASNPGAMFLSVSDSTGLLSATDSQGIVPGSGSGTLTVNAPYNDVRAALASLTYAAGANAGSDTIKFDVWDQFGIETTGTIPVTITPGGPADETWTGAVSSDWNTAGNWSGGAVPVSGQTVDIPGGTPNSALLANATLSGETITLTKSAAVSFNNVNLDSVLEASQTGATTLTIGGTLTIGPHGTLGTEQNADMLISTDGSAVPIVNEGTIASTSGFLTFLNGGQINTATVTVQNNGSIAADGGHISLDFAPPPFGSAPPELLLNNGSVSISNGGEFTLNGTFIGNGVSFAGTGALGLQQPVAFTNGASVAGFGLGDQIDLSGTARGSTYAFADGTLTTGTVTTIPLAGEFGTGNFEAEIISDISGSQNIAFAPDGGPSGVVQPDIVAPAAATVAQGSTLSPGISIDNSGTTTETLQLSAGSGTLFMNGATGSGTSKLSLGPTASDQVNADLASLTYVPAAAATSDILTVDVSPPAPVAAIRELAITITGGRTLSEPGDETVAPNATIAVGGSYADNFAANNPGELFLGISAGTGTLTATDSSGNPVAGSGTNNIALNIDFVDLNTILVGLRYTAGVNPGFDTINFAVWNQAGTETVMSTAVTIGAVAMSAADFATPGMMSPTTLTSGDTGVATASSMLGDATIQPVGMPLPLGH